MENQQPQKPNTAAPAGSGAPGAGQHKPPAAPVQKAALEPQQSAREPQGSRPEASQAEPPTAPRTQYVATPIVSPVQTELPKKEEAPLLPSTPEAMGFITRGRVIGAIALLLLISFAVDRFSVNAPGDETAGELGSEQLALIGANAPGPKTAAPGTVLVYFNNGILDTEMECEKVFPVAREVSDQSPEAALALLVAGPTAQERNEGYFTSLSPGVRVKNVGIDDDAAIADFDAALSHNVQAGSCRAQAIRAQIGETLQQFTSVEEVKILVDGAARNAFAE